MRFLMHFIFLNLLAHVRLMRAIFGIPDVLNSKSLYPHYLSINAFRAIVKQFLLTDGYGTIFEETEQEKLDKRTLSTLKTIITAEVADAELMLFGNRAKGAYDAQSDWDMLILTTNDYPPTLKWELQEKLFNVTIQQGTRVNILLAQKTKWLAGQEYEALRSRIEKELLAMM